MNLPVTDREIVAQLIPQKFPFIMVHELLEFNDVMLISSFTPSASDVFSQRDQFLAAGVMEHQAQSVALHTGYHYYLQQKPAPVGYIGAVKSFAISRLPEIGEKIVTNITILEEMMGVTLVKISSEIAGELIATSEMKTVIK